MKKNMGLIGIYALALSFTASAHAATEFGGTRYVTQTDARHTRADKGILRLDLNAQQLTFEDKDRQTVMIPYSGIDSLRSENTIDRLRRPFTNRVGRDHVLTVQYHTTPDQSQYAVFRLNGRSYQEVLAALESQTKKPIDYRSN